MKTINEMIAEALTTESRKRKANNQEELKALGYVIYKYDGAWHIKYNDNIISKKYDEEKIRNNWGYDYIRYGSMWNCHYTKRVYKPITAIDFVRLLDKKHNYNPYYREHTTYEDMQDALWNRNYYKKVLDNGANEYEATIEKIKKEYEHKLEMEKKFYLSRMQNAQRAYTDSIETINNLLRK